MIRAYIFMNITHDVNLFRADILFNPNYTWGDEISLTNELRWQEVLLINDAKMW